jgi:hypothetical protein
MVVKGVGPESERSLYDFLTVYEQKPRASFSPNLAQSTQQYWHLVHFDGIGSTCWLHITIDLTTELTIEEEVDTLAEFEHHLHHLFVETRGVAVGLGVLQGIHIVAGFCVQASVLILGIRVGQVYHLKIRSTVKVKVEVKVKVNEVFKSQIFMLMFTRLFRKNEINKNKIIVPHATLN